MRYADLHVPSSYRCSRCQAHGIKLWRQYNTIASAIDLLCAACASPQSIVDEDGRSQSTVCGGIMSDQLNDTTGKTGSLVPAVPTEDEQTYWGYTSVPEHGCAWWRVLPSKQGDAMRPFTLDPKALAFEAEMAAARQRSDDDVKQWQRDTVYLVEATSCEQHNLWREWSTEALRAGCGTQREHERFVWQQLSPGSCPTIGTVVLRKKRARKEEEFPICLTIFWIKLAGHIIAFYDATSMVVHHGMVEEWLSKEFPGVQQTDAMNFAHAVGHVRRLMRRRQRSVVIGVNGKICGTT